MPSSNCLTAEFFGTIWLGPGGCGSSASAAAFAGLGIGFAGVSLAFSLTVLTMTYAIGHVSRRLEPTGLGQAKQIPQRWWRWAVLIGLLQTVPVWAASVEGEALYQERIMPPAGAVLVVSLEDTARADAPATELASSRLRLAAGPPYRWRLDYDERLVTSKSRTVLRARIETPQGLWMSTDTVVPASTPAPVLQLRMVKMNAGRCAGADTQGGMNDCAYEEFLEASAGMSRQLRLIETALTSAQRSQWRQVQKSWLAYSTKTCQFEASPVGNGTARSMVQWQCSDRMTRQRTAELLRLTACPEGDLACPVPRLQRAP